MATAPACGKVNRVQHVWYKRLLQCSIQDLIAIYMPHVVLCGIIMVGACFLYDPTLRLLLYSAVPERHQNWLTFFVCFVEEMHMMLIFAGTAVPMWQLQVICFDQVTDHMEAIISSVMRRYYATYEHYLID